MCTCYASKKRHHDVFYSYIVAGAGFAPAPTGYAYHFSFHCPIRVRGLDYTFFLSKEACRLVSPPSCPSCSGLARYYLSPFRSEDFAEFDKCTLPITRGGPKN